MVPRLESASKALLTSVSGKVVRANVLTFPCATRLTRSGTQAATCSGFRVGRLKPMTELVAANQLLQAFGVEGVVDVAGAEENHAAERGEQLEALVSNFACGRLQDDVHTPPAGRRSDLLGPVLSL